MTPLVHFLTPAHSGGRLGWVTPRKADNCAPQDGRYVVPVRADGSLFPEYSMGYMHYRAPTNRESALSVIFFTEGRRLHADLDSGRVSFLAQGGPMPYSGRLRHPELSGPLVEIIPEDEGQLDELYEKTSLIFVGCDPFANYSE